MKKRRDESQDDLDDKFNVAEDEETSAKVPDKDGPDDEDADEVSELGQGDMISGEFDADDD